MILCILKGKNLEFFSGILAKNMILCMLIGEMPFKMFTSIFFPEKKNKK